MKVETQGSAGSKPLSAAEIAAADAVIFAHDLPVKDAGRFAGKPIVDVGVKRGISDVKKSATAQGATERTERDMPFSVVLLGIVAVFALMSALYFYFTDMIGGGLLAAVVMLVTGFFFAAATRSSIVLNPRDGETTRMLGEIPSGTTATKSLAGRYEREG